MIVVYFKIFHFPPKKVRCPLLLGPPVAKLRLRPRCWSHACQNQYPVGGGGGDTGCPILCRVINSVQQTVKSPPLSHCIQEGGSL